MDRYVDAVSRTAFRILCDHSDSEYVTGMVLEILRKADPEYESHQVPLMWLMRQTLRFSKKRHRHNRLMHFLGKHQKLYVQTAPKVDDVDDYITTQAWEIYCRTCEDLTFDQRAVYVLREIEELSEEDVMLVTGFWKGTMRMYLELARMKVKHELKKFGKVAEYEAYIGFLKRVEDSQASCSLALNSLSLRAEPEI